MADDLIRRQAKVRFLAQFDAMYARDGPVERLLTLEAQISVTMPIITLLTDFADYPPHFWIERQKQFLICGTERAQQQAFELGHDRDHVFLASGMIMKPKFYQKTSVDRKSERVRLGLDSDIPVGIVLFGGHGSGTMLHIVNESMPCPLKCS